MKRRKKVVVAMSGGIDSSAAALILKKEDYEVIGISMQLYDHSQKDNQFDSCCSLKDVDDARRVAQILDIPHYVLNFENIFKEKVIDYFTQEYLKARTPNPCIKCNEDVKFKHLFLKAKELGADFLATGHYVRKVYSSKKGYQLLKAKDLTKDQSYFLFGLEKEKLPFLLFPLGDLKKQKVREMAKMAGLPNAKKEESMEICFIPNNNYSSFLNQHVDSRNKFSGHMVNRTGEVLGRHNGFYQFTVGQRKRLGVFGKYPMYVSHIDPQSKNVTLGSNEDLMSLAFMIKDVHWITQPRTVKLSVKIRHSLKDIPCTFTNTSGNNHKVTFASPQRAVTPGQAAVFYEKDILLGGGWIEKSCH